MRRPIPHLVTLLAILLFAPPAPGQGALWVVDDDGGAGVDFAAIQPAVDAAADGDTILVKPGTYAGFVVDAKSLTLAGEDGAVVSVDATLPPWDPVVVVRNLGPGQVLAWVNLDVENASTIFPVVIKEGLPLHAHDNQGLLWFEGSELRGGTDRAALTLEGCAAVAVVRCVLRGLDSDNNGINAPSAAGLEVAGSTAFVYDTDATGGDGTGDEDPFQCIPGKPGAAGAVVDGGSLSAFGCDLVGGDGGDGIPFDVALTGAGSDGGPGVELRGTGSSLAHQDCTFTPGAGGQAINNCSGSPGVPIAQGAGSLTAVPGRLRSLEATTPVREGDAASLTFRGEAGDLVFLDVSTSAVLLPLPGIVGPLATGLPAASVLVGVLDASEQLVLPFVVQPMAPAFAARTFFLQSATLSTDLELLLGAPSAWVVLDAATP